MRAETDTSVELLSARKEKIKMKLLQCYVDNIITTALMEDINYIDAAADNLIPPEHRSSAYYVAKDTGVVCGIEVAKRVFDLAGGDVDFKILLNDGAKVNKGDIIAEMEGSTLTLLKGERTALNLLQHMSGIATATNKCVELVKGTKASVADTRKTLPGLRALQKYAVTVGGGKNHRFNLSDAAMLKDNHIDAYGSITAAVAALREKIGHTVKIEVEVRTLAELTEALDSKVEIIMLDNMNCDQMREAVEIADGRALLEASGNITSENIRQVAETGVDIISLGALTHSVKCFDVSMKIKKK
jgi:nicotinate-nucleotide pyrophosphorylase (carboxylating)